MQVKLAKTAGFCFGVKRAVETVYEQVKEHQGETIYTFGPIIHNAEVVKDLKRFDGNFILQTMFLKSPDFDTTTPEAIQAWIEIVREIRPREIMVYTIDRETPDKRLKKYTVEQMRELVQPLVDEGFNIQIRG